MIKMAHNNDPEIETIQVQQIKYKLNFVWDTKTTYTTIEINKLRCYSYVYVYDLYHFE